MRGTKHLDDHILLSLLKAVPEEDVVPKTVYRVYRSACNFIFSEVYKSLDESDWEVILDEAFVEFWDQVQYDQIKQPLKAGLISYFLTICRVEAEKHITADLATVFAMAENNIYRYTGGEGLLRLIVKGHERTESEISLEYRSPVINTLKKYYGATHEQAEWVYNPTIAEGMKSIRQGKVKTPLESKLFTFFFRIAQFQYYNRRNEDLKNREIPVEKDEILESLEPKDFDGRTYLDQLDDDHDVGKKFGVDNLADLLQKILELVTPEQKRYMIMHHLEGMKYKDMVEVLKSEGTTITAKALRKAVHDGLKKARKNLKLGVK